MTNGQQFRCITGTTLQSPVILKTLQDDPANEQVILWNSIECAFPGVKQVYKEDHLVEFERDRDLNIILPKRIKAYPETILDIVLDLRIAEEKIFSESGTLDPDFDSRTPWNKTMSGSSQTPPDADSHPHGTEASTTVTTRSPEIGGTSSKPSHKTTGLGDSTNAAPHNRKDTGNLFQSYRKLVLSYIHAVKLRHHGLAKSIMESMHAPRRELEMVAETDYTLRRKLNDMHQQTNTLQKKLKGPLIKLGHPIHTRPCRISGPIAPHFIILPSSVLHFKFNPFRTPFRLYFLCDNSQRGVEDPSRLSLCQAHVAKHGGYDIHDRGKFLTNFGSYLRETLKVYVHKTPTIETAESLPATIDFADAEGPTLETTDFLRTNIHRIINEAVISLNNAQGDYTTHTPVLQKRIKLDHLRSFFVNSVSGEAPGGLYRIANREGLTKWVCHSRYQEMADLHTRQQLLERILTSGGSFEEGFGRVSIRLDSAEEATRFYDLMANAKAVVELDISLNWDVTPQDLDQLQKAVQACQVAHIQLSGDAINRSACRTFDSLTHMAAKSRVRSFALTNCRNWFDRIFHFPSGPGTENLRSLYLWDCGFSGLTPLAVLFSVFPNLSTIFLESSIRPGVRLLSFTITSLRSESPSTNRDPGYEIRLLKLGALRDSEVSTFLKSIRWRQLARLTIPSSVVTQHNMITILEGNSQVQSLTIVYDLKPGFIDIIAITALLKEMSHPLRTVILNAGCHSNSLVVDFNRGEVLSMSLVEDDRGGESSRLSLQYAPCTIVITENDTWPWRNQHGLHCIGSWTNEREQALKRFMQSPALPRFEIVSEISSSKVLSITSSMIRLCAKALVSIEISGSGSDHWVNDVTTFTFGAHYMPYLKRFTFGPANAMEWATEDRLIGKLASTIILMTKRKKLELLEFRSLKLSPLGWEDLFHVLNYESLQMMRLVRTNFQILRISALGKYVPSDADLTIHTPGLAQAVQYGELQQSHFDILLNAFKYSKSVLDLRDLQD
ncbi:hypothetical protein BGW38_007450 [Lunasporangiospora selenospora]|uniref:Uncharacterized protein n=1 Tax=Lunasporangiospora selenospora TaxID=979761 RepID=A0A9P6KGV2_9FUNG|nr:hypothetical protein BGW38_007450 [Lunasporangiospora selenospora]